MQYSLNYSGTRFLSTEKIKITQFPGGFRLKHIDYAMKLSIAFSGNFISINQTDSECASHPYLSESYIFLGMLSPSSFLSLI